MSHPPLHPPQTALESAGAVLERVEIEYWRTSTASCADPHSVESLTNTINKMGEAGSFVFALLPYLDVFRQARSMVELGGGQGWAACIVKRLCPEAVVMTSDISHWAIRGLAHWEHVFEVVLDGAFGARSHELPLTDSSVDCVFCFSAAHHFRAHRRTLAEVQRVLAPGGHCFYFYEPTSSRVWYSLATWRLRRKRSGVREDVLVPSRLEALAKSCALRCEVVYTPDVYRRGPLETLYYAVLQQAPSSLRRLVPCTATFHFQKDQAST